MAEAPAGGAGGAKQDPQALIAKHAAVTQSGSANDAAIVTRVEASIKNSPMGWLQGMLGETSSRASAEQGEVHGKLAEHQDLVANSSKDAPKDAGPPPAPGPAAHPAVPQPAAAGAHAAVVAPQAANGGAPAEHAPIAGHAPAKTAASVPAAAPAPTIASAVAGAGNDAQLDGILNGYTPKSPQTTQTLGRIKQMGDVASGFSGQLDVYVSQGGAIDSTIAGASNFLGVGKEAGAVWRNNPYRKVHGVLGGIMTGMSAVKNVCGIVGSICGKLGMVLTVIGLLGMIFPPIGAAVSGIARILSVVGMICDAISFVLSGILTGLNGVVLAQQIAAGASAEEKAASADLMMSEANEAASGFVNLAMVFGPKFMKGMLGSSKGIVASLIKRAKATIGRISLKVSSNVSHFANKIVRKLGFGGAGATRVAGAWKEGGMVAGMKEKWAGSKVGKVFNGAPQHIEAVQEKLMAKYGNTTWAKNMDRVGAWGGSVAHRFDLEEKVGKMGENSGKWVGGLGADTKLGKSLAASAERSELQTRELTMKMEARDASHLEETRWKNELNRRQAANPEHIRDKGVENKFVNQQGDKVRGEADASFQRDEAQREAKERLEQRRTERFERRNDEFYENKTNGLTGKGSRDEMMDSVHNTRDKRWKLESDFKAQETERRDLLAKSTKSAEDQTRLTALNSELRPLDEARRVNKMYETDLSGLASGSERARKPEYNNWKDVGSNAWDATAPVLEMVHLKDQDSAWASAEKANLKKQTKYNKGAAQGNAAGRGGHGTFDEIAADARHREMDDITAFVRSAPQSTTLSGRVGSMLSPITSRVPAAPASAPAPVATPTPATPATAPQGGVTVQPTAAPTEHKEGDPGTTVALAAQVHEAPASPPVTHEEPAAEPDADGGEALPYWPALLPEFDQAQKDFGWMRKVAVEFKHAQIDGKQKAVDTLAVYGRYKEYSDLRQAAAKKNQAGAAQTGQATAANVGHAAQTEGQAGQGEAKQGEAKGAANDKAATDLPEPESRGFWGRILGAVKRWAKNKAAQVFGWIQEKVASVIMKGLCGVSMGDMREYAGALRNQQQAAHGVANEAGATSGAAATSSIKLSSDATKEAQGAADAIGECDKNIVDADTFMSDITSFESQLGEEKANAQVFISQVQAAAHAEQARKKAEAEQHAAEEAKEQQRAAQLGGPTTAAAAPTPTPTPGPGPTAEPAQAPPVSPEGEADAGQIHAAADLVAGEAESMTSRLDARAEDYTNQLALALTNRTGKGADGVDLKGPAKKESKHIVEEFKQEAAHSKTDMEAFHTLPIEASQAKRIAEQIITVAQHLESSYTQSENALDELFARTYNGIKDGKRTLKSRMLDGDNAVGAVNHAGDAVENKAIDASLPAMNAAWNKVAAPIQTPSATPAPAPAAVVAPTTEPRGLPPANEPTPTPVPDRVPAKSPPLQKPPIQSASNDVPVQRNGEGDAQVGNPSEVAAKGVGSASGRLPHHDQIQKSFGKHDISHVRAQVGGEATEASRGLGASAYATGDKIGFANSPDLHTAAHEAAHVVQQQSGVQLKGGIDGGKGDPYEQHADSVADKVVRGESAEQLLDTVGPKRAGSAESRADDKHAAETQQGPQAEHEAPGAQLDYTQKRDENASAPQDAHAEHEAAGSQPARKHAKPGKPDDANAPQHGAAGPQQDSKHDEKHDDAGAPQGAEHEAVGSQPSADQDETRHAPQAARAEHETAGSHPGSDQDEKRDDANAPQAAEQEAGAQSNAKHVDAKHVDTMREAVGEHREPKHAAIADPKQEGASEAAMSAAVPSGAATSATGATSVQIEASAHVVAPLVEHTELSELGAAPSELKKKRDLDLEPTHGAVDMRAASPSHEGKSGLAEPANSNALAQHGGPNGIALDHKDTKPAAHAADSDGLAITARAPQTTDASTNLKIDDHGTGLKFDAAPPGAHAPLVDSEGNQYAYDPHSGKAPAPKPSAHAQAGGFAKPVPAPEIPPPPQTANQEALNAFISKARADRDSQKATVQAQQLAKSAQVSVDANVIAQQVKQKNDIALASLRAKTEQQKQLAASKAAEQQQQGPVSIESLKEKLELTATTDKEKLKADFDSKQAELKIRLDTQRDTLRAESQRQIDNFIKQNEDKKKLAEAAWAKQKAQMETTAKTLMEKMRSQVAADQTRLEKDKALLFKKANERIAKVDADTAANAAKIRADGAKKAGELEATASAAATAERAKGGTQAQTIRAEAQTKAAGVTDEDQKKSVIAEATTRASAAQAASEHTAGNLEIKGKLNAKAAKDEAETQANKVTDTGKKAHDDINAAAAHQVDAIAEKINTLLPLAEEKIKKTETDLATQQKAGETQLAAQFQDTQAQIAKLKAEADAKIGKLEIDAGAKLQKDYDAGIVAIDKRVAVARAQLAAGSEKNLKALEQMVDQTCKSLDKSVTDTETKFDHTVLDAEKQAQAFVVAQLQKIKGEADKALYALDQHYDNTIKRMNDAVAATTRQIEETAKGKMLEVEVHTATLLNDTGDPSRLNAVTKQLRTYIEEKKPLPPGYGETAAGTPPAAPATAAAAAAAPATAKSDAKSPDDKKPGDTISPADKAAEEARQKLLDPKDLSEAGVNAKLEEALKKGRKQTAGTAADSADKLVAEQYKTSSAALTAVEAKKNAELEDLKTGKPEAVAEVEKVRTDDKKGQDAAKDIDAAMQTTNWYGAKSPDKKAILQALHDKTPEQIAAMREALKARTPKIDLDEFISKEMSGAEQTEARIRMTGDPIAGDIAALNGAAGHKLTGNEKLVIAIGGGITGGLFLNQQGDQNVGADKERVEQILRQYKGDDLKKFAEQYEKQTGRPLGDLLHATGNDAAAKDLGIDVKKDERSEKDIKAGADADAGKLLADPSKKIDPAKCGSAVSDLAEALQGFHLDSTRADNVRKALEGKTPDEMAYLRAEYKAKTGHDLDRDMEHQLNGAALAETKATLHGDANSAAVAKILGAQEASWTPWTVDDSKMNEELKTLTDPAQRRAVLDAYEKRTGRKLQDVIAEKMTGNDRELATALADGDQLKARMVELDEATNGGFMNGMHKAIAERTGYDTEGLTRGIANAMISPANLMSSHPDDKVTLPGGYVMENGSIHKVDADAMFKILEETPNPADRERLKALYKEKTHHDMDDDMAKSLVGPMGDQSKLDAYKAIQDGRMEDYYAAKMDDAVSGLNDTKAFHAQLEGKSERERKLIIDAFNKRHGGDPNAFVAVCNDQFGADSMDAKKAKLLASEKDDAATGTVKLPDEFALKYAQDSVWNRSAKAIDGATAIFDKYPLLMAIPGVGMEVNNAKTASYFMRGWGVDNDAIKGVLKDKSPAEIAELKAKYPELEKDLGYCLSGRDAFEVNLMLKDGAPKTPEEKIKRQLAMYEFDRGASGAWIPGLGLNKVSNGITDLISPSGQMMDAEAAALKKQLALLQAGGQLSTEQQKQLDMSLALMDSASTNFIASREEITGAIATAVGAVVGAVVTVLTGGVGGAVLAALATGLSTVAVKCAMLGQSYGRNEMGVDLAMTAVQMATAGLGGGLSKLSESFMVQVLNGAIGAAASNFAQTAITSKDAHDLLGLLAQASKSGLVGMITGGANAAAMAALSNAMSQLSAKAFGQNAPLSGIFIKGFVSGAGGSVAGMFAGAIVDPSSMSGNWDAVFANAMRGAAEAGFQNGLTEAAQMHHERGVEVLKNATEAAKAAKEANLPLEDQRAAFAKVMSEGYAGLAKEEPAQRPATPEEAQAQREKQTPANENEAPPAHEPEQEKPGVTPSDEINGKKLDEVKSDMDRAAQKETPPEEQQPKEARRGAGKEVPPELANLDAVLGGMESGDVKGTPHDQIDKNTAEAIRSGAVELVSRDTLRSAGGDLYMDDEGRMITWKEGTAAQAVGNRVYVDPAVGPEQLRIDLRHEVNHALHESDFGSKFEGDSLSRFRDELRAHLSELGPNPTREQREIVMSNVMGNYPELGPRIAELPPGALDSILNQHSEGNTINSVRLVPVYDAIENFHAFDEHPTPAQLEEMFSKLDHHDRQALGDDPNFQKFLNQDLDLPPAEIERLWEKLGTGEGPLPEGTRAATGELRQSSQPQEDGLVPKEARRQRPEPQPTELRSPDQHSRDTNDAVAQNAAAVESVQRRMEQAELRRSQADYEQKFAAAVEEIKARDEAAGRVPQEGELTPEQKAEIKLGAAPEELTAEQRAAVEKRARLEVLNDEIGRGLADDKQDGFADERREIESKFRKEVGAPEDLDPVARQHEADIDEKVREAKEKNPDSLLTDEEQRRAARKDVVDDERKLGQDLNEKAADRNAKLIDKGAAKVIELVAGKEARELFEMLLDANKQIDGKLRPEDAGKHLVAIGAELIKRVGNLVMHDPSGEFNKAVDVMKQAILDGHPDLVYAAAKALLDRIERLTPETNLAKLGPGVEVDGAVDVSDARVQPEDGRIRRDSIKDNQEAEAAANENRQATAEANQDTQLGLGRSQGTVDPTELARLHGQSNATQDGLPRPDEAPRVRITDPVADQPTTEEPPRLRVASDETGAQQAGTGAREPEGESDEREAPAAAARQQQVLDAAIAQVDLGDPRAKARFEAVLAAVQRENAASARLTEALGANPPDPARVREANKALSAARAETKAIGTSPLDQFGEPPVRDEQAQDSDPTAASGGGGAKKPPDDVVASGEFEDPKAPKSENDPAPEPGPSQSATTDEATTAEPNQTSVATAQPTAEPVVATTSATRDHVHLGEIEQNPQSPYKGKWDGAGLHDWEGLKIVCARDGYTIKAVTQDPATGVRRVEIERVGKDPKTGAEVKGKITKTIYPKDLSPHDIDTASEQALKAAVEKHPGTTFEPFGTKTKKDLTPADGAFSATVAVGDPPRNLRIQGWFKESGGVRTISSHAPAFEKTWPAVDPKDF